MPHEEMGPKDPKESLIEGEQEMQETAEEDSLANEGQDGLDHKSDTNVND